MPHAVVIRVELDPSTDSAHRRTILDDYVIPQAQALPGFLKGLWMNDGHGIGTCVVVFDTEDNARAALVPLTPAGGPAVVSSDIQAVERDV